MPTPKIIMDFYNSKEWKSTVKYIKQLKRGICEVCAKRGEEVHHIIKLTIDNLSDDHIRIGEKNLQLLCKSCHMEKRSKSDAIRSDIMFDEAGNVIARHKAPPTH